MRFLIQNSENNLILEKSFTLTSRFESPNTAGAFDQSVRELDEKYVRNTGEQKNSYS